MRYLLIVHAWPGMDLDPTTGKRYVEGPVPLSSHSYLYTQGNGPHPYLCLDSSQLGQVEILVRDYADEAPPSQEIRLRSALQDLVTRVTETDLDILGTVGARTMLQAAINNAQTVLQVDLI